MSTPINNLTSFTVLTWYRVTSSKGPILQLSKNSAWDTGFATDYGSFRNGIELCTYTQEGETCFDTAAKPSDCWYYMGFVYNYETGIIKIISQ